MYHKYRKKKEKPVNHKKQSPNKPDHTPSRPDPRFRLQNTLGNQRVGQLFKEMEIMTKLVMNEQGNVYEQEANKIAGKIVETKDTDNKEKAPDIMLQKKADVTISTPVSSEIESEIASLKGNRDFLSQRAIIQELLQRNTQKRMDLRDIFPAINVLTRVDRNEINDGDPPGVERIAGMIFDGFKRARGFQDETRKKILNGDMPVYKLDILTDAVKDIVKAEGRWEEPYSTAVENWLEGQKTAEWVFNLAGTAVEIGLTIAAFFTGGTTAVLLGLAGGAVGLGMAAYNFEIAEDIQDAAEAGRGCSYQFADVDEANINMFFATLDLFLSAIDFVLSATNALELVDNVKLRKSELGIVDVDAGVKTVNPNNIKFSQTSAGGRGRYQIIKDSMIKKGWDGPPIDVVQTPNGLVSLDNTRLIVAQDLGLNNIPVNIRSMSETLPQNMIGRFGNAKTWGEALIHRTSSQTPYIPYTGTNIIPFVKGRN